MTRELVQKHNQGSPEENYSKDKWTCSLHIKSAGSPFVNSLYGPGKFQ